MGNHRVHGDKEMVSYLLVRHTLNQRNDYILLSIAQLLIAVRSLIDHARNLGTHIILLQFPLGISHGRNKDFFLHLRVMRKPLLVVVDVIEGGTELVVVQSIRRQILDDDALQLFQFHIHLHMMLREGFDIKVGIGITIYKCLNIRKNHFLLILHVVGDAVGIIIIEFQNQSRQIIRFIKGIHQLLTDKR